MNETNKREIKVYSNNNNNNNNHNLLICNIQLKSLKKKTTPKSFN
jgi:hypothetical protein